MALFWHCDLRTNFCWHGFICFCHSCAKICFSTFINLTTLLVTVDTFKFEFYADVHFSPPTKKLMPVRHRIYYSHSCSFPTSKFSHLSIPMSSRFIEWTFIAYIFQIYSSLTEFSFETLSYITHEMLFTLYPYLWKSLMECGDIFMLQYQINFDISSTHFSQTVPSLLIPLTKKLRQFCTNWQ